MSSGAVDAMAALARASAGPGTQGACCALRSFVYVLRHFYLSERVSEESLRVRKPRRRQGRASRTTAVVTSYCTVRQVYLSLR